MLSFEGRACDGTVRAQRKRRLDKRRRRTHDAADAATHRDADNGESVGTAARRLDAAWRRGLFVGGRHCGPCGCGAREASGRALQRALVGGR